MSGLCNYPLTRRDEADMVALMNSLFSGADITGIGDERRPKMVAADEVAVEDPYQTGYIMEVIHG